MTWKKGHSGCPPHRVLVREVLRKPSRTAATLAIVSLLFLLYYPEEGSSASPATLSQTGGVPHLPSLRHEEEEGMSQRWQVSAPYPNPCPNSKLKPAIGETCVGCVGPQDRP